MTETNSNHRIIVRHLTIGGDDLKKERIHPENLNIEHMPVQMLLHQTMHLYTQYIIQLMEPSQLKPSHAGILFILNERGPCSQRELADMINVRPPSVTVALQKLERLGYIEKQPDTKDQRIVRIQISEKGKVCIAEAGNVIHKVEGVLFKNISAEEKMLMRRLIMQMRENLLSEKEFRMKDMRHPCNMGKD